MFICGHHVLINSKCWLNRRVIPVTNSQNSQNMILNGNTKHSSFLRKRLITKIYYLSSHLPIQILEYSSRFYGWWVEDAGLSRHHSYYQYKNKLTFVLHLTSLKRISNHIASRSIHATSFYHNIFLFSYPNSVCHLQLKPNLGGIRIPLLRQC